MSQAEELLNSISEEKISMYTVDPITEEHIVIGEDRYIKVPEPLKRIAVQYDHNVETVTFDCPRYWDNNDLSSMYIYINYIRSDRVKGAYLAKNVRVDEADPNMIHFDWTIGQEISVVEGELSFLVCAIKTNSEGLQEIHWNSEINTEMTISTGLEVEEIILQEYPDIINDLLTRMDQILIGDGTIIDTTLTQSGIAADAATVGQRFNEIDTDIDGINNAIKELDKVTLKEEADPTVPDWAKQPEKPSYNHNELTDGNTLAVKDGTLQTNLNAEMLAGKRINQLIENEYFSIISKYNVPTLVKLWDDYNYLSLSNKIPKYEIGMRVLIKIEHQYIDFTSSILPAITTSTEDTRKTIYAVKGFYAKRAEVFDKNNDTYYESNVPSSVIVCPVPIKPTKISCKVTGTTAHTLEIDATNEAPEWSDSFSRFPGSTRLITKTLPTSGSGVFDLSSNQKYFTSFDCGVSGGNGKNAKLYEMIINTGSVSKFNYALPSYININNLGNKLISGTMRAGKLYELVYDGTVFNAREVI